MGVRAEDSSAHSSPVHLPLSLAIQTDQRFNSILPACHAEIPSTRMGADTEIPCTGMRTARMRERLIGVQRFCMSFASSSEELWSRQTAWCTVACLLLQVSLVTCPDSSDS